MSNKVIIDLTVDDNFVVDVDVDVVDVVNQHQVVDLVNQQQVVEVVPQNQVVEVIDIAIDDDIVEAEWRLHQLSCPVPMFERESSGDVTYLARIRGLIEQYEDRDVNELACFVRPDATEPDNLDQCGICWGDIGLIEDQASYRCGHFMHAFCLNTWYKHRVDGVGRGCPVCREPNPGDRVVGPNAGDDDTVDEDEEEDEEEEEEANPNNFSYHYFPVIRNNVQPPDVNQPPPTDFYPSGFPVAQTRPRLWANRTYVNPDNELPNDQEDENLPPSVLSRRDFSTWMNETFNFDVNDDQMSDGEVEDEEEEETKDDIY